jgi:hypothetical protein
MQNAVILILERWNGEYWNDGLMGYWGDGVMEKRKKSRR